MQIKEQKIAGMQTKNCKLQLLFVVKNYGYTTINYYQIRKNRKRILNEHDENRAKVKFAVLIEEELLQTKLKL